MQTETKREFHWFWAWEDEKEEAWLRSMSNQGWHMQRAELPGWYTFTQGAPIDYVYRLDYITPNEKNADYFLLFQDAGWDYLGEMSGWQYFRKAVQNGMAPEIFSDVTSKAIKYRRVLAFLLIFFPILFINLITLHDHAAKNDFIAAVSFFLAAFLIFYVIAIVQLLRRILSLRHL